MIKFYESSKDFFADNVDIFSQYPIATQVLYDAYLNTVNTEYNYEIFSGKIVSESECVIFIQPYHERTIFYGQASEKSIQELVDVLESRYLVNGIGGPSNICDYYIKYTSLHYDKQMSYDILEYSKQDAVAITNPNIRLLTLKDEESFYELLKCFYPEARNDNSLHSARKHLENYIVYGYINNNEIVATASVIRQFNGIACISVVYTKTNHRGNGYCYELISSIIADILKKSAIPTIFVDKNNPISQHVYAKSGFTKAADFIEYLFY